MPERPSRQPASQGLRRLDGQPVTALFGISEAATESRGKKATTCINRVGRSRSRCYHENMTERPNPLTIHVSDDELAYLEMAAHRMRKLADRSGLETELSNMSPSLMAVFLVEMALAQFLEDEKTKA